MDAARLIEEREGEPRHLVRVLGPVVAAFGELDDAAAAHVGIAIGLRDLLAMPRDVIEHQPFAQRQIAQRELGRAQAAHDRIRVMDGARNGEIRSPPFKPRHLQPPLEIERHQLARSRWSCLADTRRLL